MKKTIKIEFRNPLFVAAYWLRDILPAKEETCQHEDWNMDNQIRVIRCMKCGKMARVVNYVDLFNPRIVTGRLKEQMMKDYGPR